MARSYFAARSVEVTQTDRALDVMHVVEATAGGLRRHVLDLAHGLRDLGLEQVIAYSSKRADQGFWKGVDELKARGVRFEELPMCRELRPASDLGAVRRLVALVRSLRPQVLHLHSSKAGGVGRLAALAVPGLPVVYTPNAIASKLSQSYAVIERILGHIRTDRLIAVSQSEFDEIDALRCVPRARLVRVDSGIDANSVRHEAARRPPVLPAGRMIVSCGRLCEQKDPLTLVAASREILDAIPDASFVWIGDGELRRAVESRCSELGVARRWTITGWLNSPFSVLGRGEVFVLPSRYESFGYVTLEAMALGLPVVATDVAGTRDLVSDGETGLLCPVGDSYALAGHLTALLSDRARARAMGSGGRVRAKHFSRARMARETAALYSELQLSRSGSVGKWMR